LVQALGEVRMGFPVILEHEDACGVVGSKNVKTPVIAATALILAARGADQILVPCPGDLELERTTIGLDLLPPERRASVKLVDRNGEILRHVREYLRPLSAGASEWPESAFVGFIEDFLYQVALGSRDQAGILGHSVDTVRGFVPIIRPERFKGEARFRLAELVALVCDYEPHELDHGAFRFEFPTASGVCPEVWELLDNAEFRSLVSVSGRLGYLKHPLIGLKKLQRAIQKFFSREDAKMLLSLAKTTAECAGAGSAASSVEHVLEAAVNSKERSFRPPFLGVGPARLGIYRLALADGYPDAEPPKGAIMLFEHSRAGKIGHSWLNIGEETKLEQEAVNPRRRRNDFEKAIAARGRFALK
jgi:hypothetical protein